MLVFRTGGDFHFADVELLARKITNITPGVQVFCLYDKVTREYQLKHFTVLPMENHWQGWWAKMNLFSPELEQYRPFLYLDLDTVVLGDLGGILHDMDQSLFVCLEDFYRQGWLASGMMWLPKGSVKIARVWDEWIGSPEKHMKRWRGDQDFIRSVVTADAYWQEITNKICSFKPRVLRGWLKHLPKELLLVCFHGYPRIFEAAKTVEWVKNYINQE